jgi:hypothetical protein
MNSRAPLGVGRRTLAAAILLALTVPATAAGATTTTPPSTVASTACRVTADEVVCPRPTNVADPRPGRGTDVPGAMLLLLLLILVIVLLFLPPTGMFVNTHRHG